MSCLEGLQQGYYEKPYKTCYISIGYINPSIRWETAKTTTIQVQRAVGSSTRAPHLSSPGMSAASIA